MTAAPTFATRVRLQNYKSIKSCDVRLGRLAILVGPNGSGKSNFLDALRFTSESLTTTLDHALRDRGGINEVRRRSGGHPNHFSVRFDFQLPSGHDGHYSFRVGARQDFGHEVTDEECVVRAALPGDREASYRIRAGELVTNLDEKLPAVSPDRLFLVSASNVPAFRPVFDALTGMGFYNLSPAAIRQVQTPDPGTLLRRDGSNLASVLGHLEQNRPEILERVVEYLRQVSPGVEGVSRVSVGPMESISFRQRVEGQARPWRFAATNMSDGTLRGLGVLVAMLQANGKPPTLVAIEEPEVALHPAAVGFVFDAIRDASRQTQILATSHSPDLLDREDLEPDEILAVTADDGVTTIGPLSEVSKAVLRDRLFTAGEMLRLNQLAPDRASQLKASGERSLFET